MNHLKFTLLLLFAVVISVPSYGQFWFGPKGGIQLIDQVYQDKSYKDHFKAKPVISWHAGAVVNYTISEHYSIHMELLYERVGRKVTNRPDTSFVDSRFTYNFLSIPVMFRYQFGREPVRFYVNGGPQFKFWLSGKGTIFSDELLEFDLEKQDYNVRFERPTGEAPAGNRLNYFVPFSNRLQYAFVVGGGISLDLFNLPQRLMIDARFAWGHSIMAFNRETDNIGLLEYAENWEFTDNTITIGMAYLFGYNPHDALKGASTIPKKKKR
ncbi:MAG: porin family protein [Cyclobacteriaceae bacterium]